MKRNIILSIAALLMALLTVPELYCGPVRQSDTFYTQPDGSTFAVKVRGDEWLCIRTTKDGCAIIRDEDGWWCYGTYDEDCRLESSGYRIGEAVPSDILTRSRDIPYGALSKRAAARRQKVRHADIAALNAVRELNSVKTRSGAPIHKKGIAILAQFQDVKFTRTKEDFQNLLNQRGYDGTGSAKDYYEEQFGEGWEFSFDVSDIVTLPFNLKYYGENSQSDDSGSDIRPATMAWHACKAADDYVDFSLYDQDGDGKVDNVYIFYAGYDESENSDQPDLLWAHQYYIISGQENVPAIEKLDGVHVDRYACSSELSSGRKITGIGTFCHEYMHTFGVPDFYDTDYDADGAMAAGLWKKTSLMDGGNYNNNSATPPNLNCIERHLLGLSEPLPIEEGHSYTLEPVHKNGQYHILSSSTEGEYFLFECRSNEGWDKYIGGKGMLVYHIDRNAVENVDGYGMVSKWTYNTVNTDPLHQCADLIEADGRNDDITDTEYPYSNIMGIFYPRPDVTSITPENTPAFRLWENGTPEISIIGITSTNEGIRFSAVNSTDIPEIPDIAGFGYQVYPDAIFITFKSSNPLINETAMLEWGKNGETQTESVKLNPSQDGYYYYLITGLESGSVLYDIKVRFSQNSIFGKPHQMSVMTKRSPSISWPYLYLNSGEISQSEGMVAHVVNAEAAVGKTWYLDGQPLAVGDDCKIHPAGSGTLSCEITWKNGSSDVVVKEITIKE